MANNRLYLTCKRTGEKVMLAKYYPSTGWHVRNDELVEHLNQMFARDTCSGHLWDSGVHALEYEVGGNARKNDESQTKTPTPSSP